MAVVLVKPNESLLPLLSSPRVGSIGRLAREFLTHRKEVTGRFAALTSHLQHGFFMNWFGQQKGVGFELHLLAAGIAPTLALIGGGTASVDRAAAERLGC